MQVSEIREHLVDLNPEALLLPDMDDALLGYASVRQDGFVAVYDADRIIEILVERDKLDLADAMAHFHHNIGDAYVGRGTPIYVWRPVE